MFPKFALKVLAEAAKSTVMFILGLGLIGAGQRIADYYEFVPAQKALSLVDGILIQERTNVVAQGPVVVISDPSNTAVVNSEPAAQ